MGNFSNEYVAINDRDLENHIDRWHSKTSYPCSMCNFTSNCPSQLTSHKNTIHWKRFPCDDCDYEGISTKDRNKHIQTSHKTINSSNIWNTINTWKIRFKI